MKRGIHFVGTLQMSDLSVAPQHNAWGGLTNLAWTGAATSSVAYTYSPANQRVRSDLADGSYWVYNYDQLGQLTQATRYWADGSPVAGQIFAYGFDDIGNRTATTNNGDNAVYTANLLNQYEERGVPGRARVMGSALPEAIVTVNTEQTTRQQDGYFHWSMPVVNTNGPAYPGVSILSVRV